MSLTQPEGSLVRGIMGYFGDFHQARYDLAQYESSPFKAELSLGFYSLSTAASVDVIRGRMGLRPLLSEATRTSIDDGTWAAAALTIVDVFGIPYLEYLDRNDPTPPPLDPSRAGRLERQWSDVYGPELKQWTEEYSRLKCDEVLNGK